MVKYTIQKIEYNWNGKINKIVAKRVISRYDTNYSLFDCKRVWSRFCSNIDREDIYNRETNYKSYTPISKKMEKQLRKKEEVRSREERRQNCKCKEICLNEFKSCQVE